MSGIFGNEEAEKAAQYIAEVGSGQKPASGEEAASAYKVIVDALNDIWNSRLARGEETIGLNWFGLDKLSPLPEILIIFTVLAGIMYYFASNAEVSTYDIIKPDPKKAKAASEAKKEK